MTDDADVLAAQLARLYADYNYVHPFREGNGRTGTLMLHIVTTLRGQRLDLSTFSRGKWYAASHDSMPPGRGGTADHRPFIGFLTARWSRQKRKYLHPFMGGSSIRDVPRRLVVAIPSGV